MSQDIEFDRLNRSPRLSDTVAERLLDAVVTQQFRSGDALPSERDLSAQFGVSRTVIREAIRSLSSRGVVEVTSGRGVQVLPVDTSAVSEAMSLLVRRTADGTFTNIHEVRLMLEPHVAGVAAHRADAADIANINRFLDRMASVVAAGGSSAVSHRDFDSAQRPDVELHRAIASAAHNELYLMLFDSIVPSLFVVRAAIFASFEGPFPFLSEYQEIVSAIERREPILARDAMEHHLNHVETVWHEHLAREALRKGDDGAGAPQ